jgi:hypothetical protein
MAILKQLQQRVRPPGDPVQSGCGEDGAERPAPRQRRLKARDGRRSRAEPLSSVHTVKAE